jgi:hypothetical protein
MFPKIDAKYGICAQWARALSARQLGRDRFRHLNGCWQKFFGQLDKKRRKNQQILVWIRDGVHNLIVRVYIESTIPSYLVARTPRSMEQALHQKITKRWWETERKKHELFSSQVTIDEVSLGEAEMADARLRLLAETRLLELTKEAEDLALAFVDSGIIPTTADRDALHIALAATHRMDILLSWNCRHIVNASIQVRLRRFAAGRNVQLPLLCTPAEFFELEI